MDHAELVKRTQAWGAARRAPHTRAVGGLALILGIATRWVAIPLAFDMLVALVTVHLAAGFFVSEGGYELMLLLLAATVALILGGSGTLARENVVRGRRAALTTEAA